jgi:hypothetical protein
VDDLTASNQKDPRGDLDAQPLAVVGTFALFGLQLLTALGCWWSDPRRHDIYEFDGDVDPETGDLLGITVRAARGPHEALERFRSLRRSFLWRVLYGHAAL